jgi:predicted NAD/FAD-binding protein
MLLPLPIWSILPLSAIMATPTPSIPRKKVAIIGSGAAGIGALWALNRSSHDVYLYEAADRLGGHTNTVEFKHEKYRTAVDTGFIALNTATSRRSALCPSPHILSWRSPANFIAFLKAINIPSLPTEMSFGVTRDRGRFEWAGPSLSAVFAQRSNLLSARMWRMLFDIVRFNQFALDLLRLGHKTGRHINGNSEPHAELQETIEQYLEREGYSNAFRHDYLIPLIAAVWGTSANTSSLDLPAVTLVRFMWVWICTNRNSFADHT